MTDVAGALLAGVTGLAVGWPDFGQQGYLSVWFGAIAVGAMLLLPRRRWWPYVLVLVAATFVASKQGGWSPETSAIRAVTDLVVAVAATWAMRRFRCLPLRSSRDAWTFILVVDVAGGVRSSVAAALTYWAPPGHLGLALPTVNVGLSTAIGLLAVVPFMVLAFDRRRWPETSIRRIGSGGLMLAGITLLVIVTDLEPPGFIYLGIGFLIIPVFVVLAVRFHPLLLASGLVVASVGIALGTARGLGPFAIRPAYPGSAEHATLTAQIFLTALVASNWILAAAVAERVRVLGRLRRQVNTDPVTGLRSRIWMLEHLEGLLEAEMRSGQPPRTAVMFVDLSPFDQVRRSLGFSAGDAMLKQLALELERVAARQGTLGRFGGDRLIVVTQDYDEGDDLGAWAERLLAVVRKERMVGGKRLARQGFIGMAVAGRNSTAETLLRDADLALATAVDLGVPGWKVYDDSDLGASRQLALEHDFREALELGQVVAYYQPKVRLLQGELTGYEALARWEHPTRGLMSPAEFIPMAERTGLIVPLGQRMLEESCAMLAMNPGIPAISVNVSPLQMAESDWMGSVVATTERFGVEPARVILELTETAIFRLTDEARRFLLELTALGFGLHVDDFGTGFSSVSNLRDLPVTGLKLDMTFVRNLTADDHSGLALVRGLAGLANGLGLETIAEGVETPEQAELLARTGWSEAQGYLYGRPARHVVSLAVLA